MKHAPSIACVLVAVLSAQVPGEDWNRFRGPNGNSVVDTATLPTSWSEQSNVRWKVKIPGRGWSQPIVTGDRIFVTTAVCPNEEKPRRGERGIVPDAQDARKNDYQWKLVCVDANSGEIQWERTVFEGKPVQPKHRTNTYASETPATDGECVIAYFGMRGIACYDLEGNLKWRKGLGAFPTQAGWGTGSSPVIFDDKVYVQCDNQQSSFLIALNKQTGDEISKIDRDEKSNWSTPYLWKNKLRTELVLAGGLKMRSYDPQTGKLLWQLAGNGRTSVSPVGNDELVYLDSVEGFQGSPGQLMAVKAGASGEIPLKEDGTAGEFLAWSHNLHSYRNASPLLHDGCLYQLEQSQGIVRCFDARTGDLKYQQRLPETVGFTASPWVNDGKLFFLDETGLTVMAEPGPELKILGTNRLDDDMFWASIAVYKNRLLIRGMQHLYCIAN